MLVVETPADDPTLLSAEELVEALGGADLDNGAIERLNERVSEMLAGACNLQRVGDAVLTLRQETLVETIRLRCPVDVLPLSRKPIVEVVSVEESGSELAEDDDFEVDSVRGLLRIQSDCPSWWAAGKIVVTYKAGFAAVPPALKELAAKMAVLLHSERGRDPSLGSLDIPGVGSETYRYGRPDDPLVPAEIIEGLRAGGFLRSETMVG